MDRGVIDGEKVSRSYLTCIIRRKNIELGIFKNNDHTFKLLRNAHNTCSIQGRLFNAHNLKNLISYGIKNPLLIAIEGDELNERIGPAGDLALSTDSVEHNVALGNNFYYHFSCPYSLSLQYTIWALEYHYQLLICTTIHRAIVEVWLKSNRVPKSFKQLVEDVEQPHAAHYGLFMLRHHYE